MTEFTHPIDVVATDIDELGHVNNVNYVRYIQEISEAHWHSVATPGLKAAFIWVVLRHEIDYKAQAFAGDQLIGTTWVGAHHGARFDRYVRLVRQRDQCLICESKTTWCLLDARSHRPVRIGDDLLARL